MKKNKPEDQIILAIDGLNLNDAIKLIDKCQNLKWIKIGLELFSKEGPSVIKIFKEMGKKIFLDLKFHDIPNTMKSACYEVSQYGVDMISIHAMAGYKALKLSKEASVQGANDSQSQPPIVVGITVLTSISTKEFQDDLGMQNSIEDQVLRLAKLCYDSGLDGCVCSPLEVKNLRLFTGNKFKLITPGIRLETNDNNDQNRVMTPTEAISNGANHLVIGRSITKSNNPNEIFSQICKMIS